MYKRILVPTDGSACSEQGVRHAVNLARRTKAALHFLYVVEPLPPAVTAPAGPGGYAAIVPHMEDYFVHLRQAGEAAVESAQRLARRAGLRSTGEVAGPAGPVSTIARVADRRRADLIVMGSHGRSGLQRFMLGSVTEGVLRRTRRPLLVVPCAARRRRPRTR